MRCPACGCEDDKVVDSRAVKDGAGVRRRRECTRCLHRFTTYEGIIQEELKEDFDKDKLRRGIENACYKRPIGQDAIDRLVEEVANCIQKDFDKEVSSTEVGNRVMNALRQLDQVAYVRFASVYRKFKDVDEFIEEIKTLEKR